MNTSFWITLAVLWLVSPVILFVAFMVYRSRNKQLHQQLAALRGVKPPPTMTAESARSSVGGERRFARVDLENLLLLRLELLRQVELGALPAARCRSLTDALDLLWAWHLREGGAQPDNGVWEHRRALAWGLLAHWAEMPIGAPPWQAPTTIEDEAVPVTVTPGPGGSGFSRDLTPTAAVASSRLKPLPPGLSSPGLVRRKDTAEVGDVRKPDPVPASVWRPAAPSRLEQALQVLSGWPALIAPFLVQNIGWFIGGFCFVAGALFLIANTSGFVNALVVFGSLFGATAFLLWAGFQFRRQRAELVVPSSVLLTLGMLLGPLVVAVAVRLVAASLGDGLLMIVSVPVAVATLGAFGLAAALASALMDRALQGRYPWLLTGLAAVQLAVPLAVFATGWPALAALHTLLLVLLGYGLWRFAGEWLRRLFVDQWRTTYYAAGLLVYTALVSFVHLTWVWPQPLPGGYAGPFLMALCGLLLPVDAAFKEWVSKYAFLSRFTFALYGLSVVALAVALQSTPAAILTLAMGAALYAWMTWQYRTLPPLYLLFGCVAGLYGFVILKPLPPAWHGLTSLPALLALLGLARWAAARSRNLAIQCLVTFALLLCAVTLWSLVWTSPGALSGVATAATAALLAYVAVRLALRLPDVDPRWARADVGVVVLATVAVAFMPDAWRWGWELSAAFGLLALAALWTTLGLHHRGQPAASRRLFIAAALFNVPLALGLGGLALWPGWLGRLEPILLLVPAGALLLWLCLGLRRQALFYGVLACAGGIGVLVKQRYAPGPGTGLVDFILVLALWAFLWRLAWRARISAALDPGSDAVTDHHEPPGAGLWSSAAAYFDPSGPHETSLAELVRAPLEQAMVLLWALGLLHLGLPVLADALSPGWPWITALAVGSGVLVVSHFHLFRWVALPMLLGLVGLLVGLDQLTLNLPWLGAAAVLYALLVWRLSVDLLERPSTGRLAGALHFTVPGRAGGRRQVEDSLHAGAMLVAAIAVAAVPTLVLAGLPTPEWLPTLALSLLLFLLAGWQYRTEIHAWAALAALTVGAWLTGAWLAPPALLVVGQPVLNGCLSLGLAVAAVGLEAERARPLGYWRRPLQRTSGLLYLLALGGAVLGALADAPRLPVLLGLLCVALFPVARPLPDAAHWRGLGLALLTSALVWSLAVQSGFELRAAAWIAVAWGYVLWGVGNLVLPRWNARWPGWAAAPTSWPLLGLAGVLGGVTVGALAGAWSSATALAGLTPYLFLLLANTAWPGMAWLAVASLAGSGLLAAGAWAWGAGRWLPEHASGFAVVLPWLNLLLFLVPFWRRYGRRLAARLSWRQDGLAAPLFWIPFAILVLLLAALLLVEAGDLLRAAVVDFGRPVGWLSGLALLLAATASHAWRLRPGPLTAQVLLMALTATVVAILLDLRVPLLWLPLVAALWNGVLLLAWRYGPGKEGPRAALAPWLTVLPVVSLGLLVPLAPADWVVCTLTLWLLALVTLARGWWQGSGFWLKAGLTSALAGGYAAWLVGMPPMVGVLPWYALQTVLLLLAFIAVQRPLASLLERVDPDQDADRFRRISEAEQAVSQLVAGLLALSLLWLGLHGWFVLAYQAGWGPLPWRFGRLADTLAAGTALLLLAGLLAVRAWRQPDEHAWVYAAALLLGLLAGYGRLVVLGLAPFTPWDTAALLAVAGATLLLYQLTGSWPVSRLALLLPAVALVTVPWQLASPWAGGALLAVAVLYLSQAATLRNPWPLYLGVLALNGAVYLWAPLWAAHYGLWQFYIVPAAVSVLVLLHLHRRELRPQVLGGARLAALSALYAGAGVDLFLRPELGVFVLALALALVGVILGIALRIRVFLYAGVAFLVLNVGGQLVRFYPGQGLSRALILIGLGVVITAGMVAFNLKRESILRRIRIAQADLADWE
ncbi:hypothetical protein [uncultured Thiodictyon sp.]|uniref:hypothetical protein n=1 Tax=uncultured Thiodictyon sp. TaxID=1846217 RepID=UPI0025D6A5F3|nr:hypothetical protein [uncultured Thiodictyon sp.]